MYYVKYTVWDHCNELEIACIHEDLSVDRDRGYEMIKISDQQFVELYGHMNPPEQVSVEDYTTIHSIKRYFDTESEQGQLILELLEKFKDDVDWDERTVYTHPEEFGERTDSLLDKMDEVINKLEDNEEQE